MASATQVKSFRDLVGAPRVTASPADSTLVIIDAQNEYAQGNLKTVNVDQTRKAIASLLERYRAAGDGKNIVHVVHKTPDGAPVFTPGTALAEEFDELKPRPGEKVIQKQKVSSFADTDLHDYLSSLGERGKKTVLTGYMAHVCVSTTARAGADLGYNVVLAADAIGDRDIPGFTGSEVTDAVLKELGDAFGTVVQSAEVK
ncbi:Epoxide hydrolase penJ [Exophiala dermatitidis]